jgi:hypothetical protein
MRTTFRALVFSRPRFEFVAMEDRKFTRESFPSYFWIKRRLK